MTQILGSGWTVGSGKVNVHGKDVIKLWAS